MGFFIPSIDCASDCFERKECFHRTFGQTFFFEQSCNISRPHLYRDPERRVSRHRVKLSAAFPPPDLFVLKGRSARRLSQGLADEISIHDGPGYDVCEDDVGRRLASSPEALLR